MRSSRSAAWFAAAASAVALAAASLTAPAASATAAPAVSPSPRASASPDPDKTVHLATVTCNSAPFYSWPGREGVPFASNYAPARQGDAFDVIGRSVLTLTGQDVYETTIDVVEPFGTGRHYYIDARCVLANP